ncbi:hypothetical protein [Alteromonas lipotrueiana]|uniref:hypothetical protein n=1 Tax=Alteromonas lipotrueiana TaxID=2803815 RepID=UPI001C470EA1|nr:hypothetical protein [Alteromonas lipotrueiana]
MHFPFNVSLEIDGADVTANIDTSTAALSVSKAPAKKATRSKGKTRAKADNEPKAEDTDTPAQKNEAPVKEEEAANESQEKTPEAISAKDEQPTRNPMASAEKLPFEPDNKANDAPVKQRSAKSLFA